MLDLSRLRPTSTYLLVRFQFIFPLPFFLLVSLSPAFASVAQHPSTYPRTRIYPLEMSVWCPACIRWPRISHIL
ncbi:hypothetical protein F5B18DRAFT_606534 [Nemania serpens]|nr:hypothetical protein F5B18DRAFT_606534 [Nemania serpens]